MNLDLFTVLSNLITYRVCVEENSKRGRQNFRFLSDVNHNLISNSEALFSSIRCPSQTCIKFDSADSQFIDTLNIVYYILPKQ